ncbi:hypothetical protein N8143_03595, partial [Pelagibacteraceae bacterium]|nr:hypothetical protein [Pelagibacteraceae bacterium]
SHYNLSSQKKEFVPFPFCINSELMLALNTYLFTKDEKILNLLKKNIDSILNARTFKLGFKNNSCAWSFKYIIKNQLIIDYPTSASIFLPILLYMCHTGDLKYLSDAKILANEIRLNLFSKKNLFKIYKFPINQISIILSFFQLLYFITKEKYQLNISKKISKKIKNYLKNETQETICWPYKFEKNKHKIGERYWKSTWVVQSLIVSNQLQNHLFCKNMLKKLANSFKTNIARPDGYYDSLSKNYGDRLNDLIIKKHKSKGQFLPLQKIMNFSILINYDNSLLNYFRKIYLCPIFFSFKNLNNERNLFYHEGLSYIFFHTKNCLKIKDIKINKHIDD